jgi:uncharacterized protein (DUF2267 family)
MDERAFFAEVGERLRCDQRRAEGVTFAVFQELREHVTDKEAGDVAAQLPTGLKRLWREWERSPGAERAHAPEFVGRVRMRASLPDDREAERAILVVFGVLQALLGSPTGTEGEAWDVFSVLPKDLKRLWLAAAQTHAVPRTV